MHRIINDAKKGEKVAAAPCQEVSPFPFIGLPPLPPARIPHQPRIFPNRTYNSAPKIMSPQTFRQTHPYRPRTPYCPGTHRLPYSIRPPHRYRLHETRTVNRPRQITDKTTEKDGCIFVD